jgi:hypothetical protein
LGVPEVARPGPKPPFPSAAAPVPITAYTTMVPAAWERALQQCGYSGEHPELTATILEGMRVGVRVDYHGDRSLSRTCRNLKSALGDAAVKAKVTAVIDADVQSGKKAGPFDAPPFAVFSASPIGAVPKRDSDKIRVIHHLSFPFGGDSINSQIRGAEQPLGSFEQASDAVRRLGAGCFLVKLDVEAAYKQIPVHPDDWPLLGFCWEGKWYYERVLPFGLKSSCRLWELYATALHRMMERILGVKCVIHYIDDFLFVVGTKSEADKNLKEVSALCSELGLPMAASKTEGPTTCLTFLGIEIDTVAMEARLSASKLAELQLLLKNWGGKQHATISELESLTGKLQWVRQVVRPGRFFLRRIIDFTTACRKTSTLHHHLSADLRADIDWWRAFAPNWNGVSLLYHEHWLAGHDLELFTDACERGYGCLLGQEWCEGEWSQEQRDRAWNPTKLTRSMPFFELLAIVIAAATWGQRWRGLKIKFRTDCLPVHLAIVAGSSRAQRTMALLRHLATLAAHHGFDFTSEWIKGSLNVAADALSRGMLQEFRAAVPNANQHRTHAAHLPPLHQM